MRILIETEVESSFSWRRSGAGGEVYQEQPVK